MAEHRIALSWTDGGKPFAYETYPREHAITYKSGQAVTTSAAPAYRGDGVHADPEDLLVAALSSCHMLSFLAICAKKRLAVKSYDDDAVGFLENEGGKLWIPKVILRPKIDGDIDAATLEQIHHLAHEQCFIANSVKTEVVVEPR
jgi:organic hydroperoxide reductase OsmC/OhrA